VLKKIRLQGTASLLTRKSTEFHVAFIYLLSVFIVFGELTEEMEIVDGSYCSFVTSLHRRVQGGVG
jgi:hypothetical protein